MLLVQFPSVHMHIMW